MSKITEAVAALAEPIVHKHGCELWGVDYVKEGGNWYLRVYIDKPEGISINHCEAVSIDLDPVLDEHEHLVPGSYTFEVSSAGVERKLRGPSDFERFSGSLVELKLYKSIEGVKSFKGTLAAWSEGEIELDISGGRRRFAEQAVAGVWLRLS